MIRGTHYVCCPCCGDQIKIKESDLDLDIDVFTVKCTNKACKHDIEVTVEYKPVFHTAPLKQGTCLECNKDVRYTLAFENKVSKYSMVDDSDYCLCRACENRLKAEEALHAEGPIVFKMRKRK